MENNDQEAELQLEVAMQTIDDYYKERGIFQDRFGFGEQPAIVVVDFAYGWTDEAYAAGSRRLDQPVEQTSRLIAIARPLQIPIVYTTSPWRPETGDQPLKSAADRSETFRSWDQRAVQIDERLAPQPEDYVIEKESASAFSGTHLAGYLVDRRVDTVLITGCSTSACIRATATDAKSLRFRPIVVRECVGDRAAAAHIFTLFDIQARFADVRSLDEVLTYLREPPS
ncbi:MAG: isochorismatase family protein [Pirellulaceae bacterium]|jgi:nicotinamidase-related amidase|nr:isochorismatase family protein [Pirellulaceae bacterium]MDP7305754.1 isochorismatase family protein [Pirellulaceae bacterium]HJN08133.1 isochorismatase family protein [Pirellulaceae bacterium]